MIKAEYIGCTRNILGDIEGIEIKDNETHKHKVVTPEQIVKAVQEGKIQIKYIKVSSDGTLHITKKNKYTIADKIKSLEKEIEKLYKDNTPDSIDKAIEKGRLRDMLKGESMKCKKYNPEDFEIF